MAQDALELGEGGVLLATAQEELVGKATPHVVEPGVVVGGLTDPNRTGMVTVSDLVALVSVGAVGLTVSGGEQLSILDQHLGAVNVSVVAGTLVRSVIEVEDIHDGNYCRKGRE